MSGPQIAMVTYLVLGLLSGALLHGRQKVGHHNFLTMVITVVTIAGILWWGGFWEAAP
jgi:hypothetical protein